MGRTCPNCGAAERRWTENGREQVNLSPITNQCVDCLAAMTKELGPLRAAVLPFDSRAAAANDQGEP